MVTEVDVTVVVVPVIEVVVVVGVDVAVDVPVEVCVVANTPFHSPLLKILQKSWSSSASLLLQSAGS